MSFAAVRSRSTLIAKARVSQAGSRLGTLDFIHKGCFIRCPQCQRDVVTRRPFDERLSDARDSCA